MRKNIANNYMVDFIKNHLKTFQINVPLYKYFYLRGHKSKLTVIAFHRVVNKDDLFLKEANPLWTVTEEQFYYIIKSLNEYYQIINPLDIKNFYLGNLRKKRPMIITFDDGWMDNYLYAYPILQKFKIKALFFIATEAIGSNKYFWEESIYARLCREKANDDLLVQLCKKIRVDNCIGKNFVTFANKIIEKLYSLEKKERNSIINEINLKSDRTDRQIFLGNDEIQEMFENGMIIGSHGNTHDPCMSENVDKEIADSRERIKESIGVYPIFFSWPHGIFRNSFINKCRKNGLKYVFTSKSGLNSVTDSQFEIKRYFIPNWRFNLDSSFKLNKRMIDLMIFKDIR